LGKRKKLFPQKRFFLFPKIPSLQKLRADYGLDAADTAAGAFFFPDLEALEFGGVAGVRPAANFFDYC